MRGLIFSAMLLALASVDGLSPIVAQKEQAVTAWTSRDLWSVIKRSLVAADGEDYFKENLKGSIVPGGAGGLNLFTGTLLSAEPAAQPSVLVLAISDSANPEVTLRFKDAEWKDTHLSGPLMHGCIIQFEGVPASFTKEPFMLTFDVSLAHRSRSLTSTVPREDHPALAPPRQSR
jgi:hypothetical protein